MKTIYLVIKYGWESAQPLKAFSQKKDAVEWINTWNSKNRNTMYKASIQSVPYLDN